MGDSKLMTPLFYNGNFNREGRKMRAVFEREISNGPISFRLWRSAGAPDVDYPRTENDKYLIYIEANHYLFPLGMTEFALTDRCGFAVAVKKLYGTQEERERHFDCLRKAEDSSGVAALLAVEREEIERCGGNPACQTDYIVQMLEGRISTYLEAKENGGRTFPDFIGALILEDLTHCASLSEIYKAQQREKELARAARAAEEEKAFCDEQNKAAEAAVSYAVQILRQGGELHNETITFHKDRYSYSSYSIINYLMRQYQVAVPLRTQGWINDKLTSATIKDGTCEHLRYLCKNKGRASQKFFGYMDDLIRAVTEQAEREKTA